MVATRGHKYHILPSNVYPIVMSLTILLFVLTIIVNLHLELRSAFLITIFFNIMLMWELLISTNWLNALITFFFPNIYGISPIPFTIFENENITITGHYSSLNAPLCGELAYFKQINKLNKLLNANELPKIYIDNEYRKEFFETIIIWIMQVYFFGSPNFEKFQFNEFDLEILKFMSELDNNYINSNKKFSTSLNNINQFYSQWLNLIPLLPIITDDNLSNEISLPNENSQNSKTVQSKTITLSKLDIALQNYLYEQLLQLIEEHYDLEFFFKSIPITVLPYIPYIGIDPKLIDPKLVERYLSSIQEPIEYVRINIDETLLNEFNNRINEHGKYLANILSNTFYSTEQLKILSAGEWVMYITWISPFLLILAVFFLWAAAAIDEGTELKISAKPLVKSFNVEIFNQFYYASINHTNLVWKGFKIGFILFIISEVMLFFGFFWSFFHSALSPAIQIGGVWPPVGVDFITVKGFAIANTIILLTSGMTLTMAHLAFELVPQRWNRLYTSEIPYSDEPYQWVDRKSNYNHVWIDWEIYCHKPLPIHWMYKAKWFLNRYGLRWWYHKHYYFFVPFEMLFPFLNSFTISYFWWETEMGARLFINLMIDTTLWLALLFMIFQGIEYFISPVSINSGVYGSTFYMITGLHGMHVFIGSCFLMYCRISVYMNWIPTLLIHFIEILVAYYPKTMFERLEIVKKEKLGELKSDFSELSSTRTIDHWYYGNQGIESFECAAWYWHFVDVVWIFVFAFVYVWSHLTVLDQQ